MPNGITDRVPSSKGQADETIKRKIEERF